MIECGGTHKYPWGEDIYLSDVGWKKNVVFPLRGWFTLQGTNKKTNKQTDRQTDRQTKMQFPKFIALDSVVTY